MTTSTPSALLPRTQDIGDHPRVETCVSTEIQSDQIKFWCLEPIPADIGREAGFTLDR
ncbi:Hypothetical protein SMAX5B_016352 [Scophthalmus maximus]|uniref:Uncharacterized protein n=1 Tax=Scophthalmus maximus TaxID=52904 RepID=A0A2U9C4K3_SCOMX|nr:Hypothetical protein SMAX5B_016352 [Scophthalmus maximus]